MSDPPPAAKGTINRIGREGKSCADVAAVPVTKMIASNCLIMAGLLLKLKSDATAWTVGQREGAVLNRQRRKGIVLEVQVFVQLARMRQAPYHRRGLQTHSLQQRRAGAPAPWVEIAGMAWQYPNPCTSVSS
ncbi:hypothetical protein D9M69_581050 [compost metagenome]